MSAVQAEVVEAVPDRVEETAVITERKEQAEVAHSLLNPGGQPQDDVLLHRALSQGLQTLSC